MQKRTPQYQLLFYFSGFASMFSEKFANFAVEKIDPLSIFNKILNSKRCSTKTKYASFSV